MDVYLLIYFFSFFRLKAFRAVLVMINTNENEQSFKVRVQKINHHFFNGRTNRKPERRDEKMLTRLNIVTAGL